tara:strand:- start:476 stop:1396 length:921 start_codon:yes stop_codon:yes gene_type:complete
VGKIKKNQMNYHKPVLLHESVHGLRINPKGVYVDATFGGGGHSKLILQNLKKGKLFAFDQDKDTKKNLLKEDGFKLTQANFRYIKNFLRLEGVTQIDGLLADLGVSSYQFDVAERGFSIRHDSELDMRMNTDVSVSAKDIINKYDLELLANVFYKYGELRNSRKIANYIVKARNINPIHSTNQLIDIVSNIVPIKRRNQFLARVFQAIRIEVNDEINALEEMLTDTISMLKKGGRIVVISYHSLEDRLVKNLFNKGNLIGKIEKDFFGNKLSPLIPINKNVITPNNVEISNNSRSRSAKLRIAEKL